MLSRSPVAHLVHRSALVFSPRTSRPRRSPSRSPLRHNAGTSASATVKPARATTARQRSPKSANASSIAQILSPVKAAVVRRRLRFDSDATDAVDSFEMDETQMTPSSLQGAVVNIVDGAIAAGEWRFALDQLRFLLPHSERLAPWQQHAALLMNCADMSLRLGNAAKAAEYAVDAVDLHRAASADGPSVVCRVLAARCLEKSGRRAEAAQLFTTACNLVETAAATPLQTTTGGMLTVELDPAVPFIEYAKLQELCGNDAERLDLLVKAINQPKASSISVATAHHLTAKALLADTERDAVEVDKHFQQAVATLPDTEATRDMACDMLYDAAMFAQHRLRSVDRAAAYYTRLFELRPVRCPSTDGVEACTRIGEQLLNAGSCFEQHPNFGCAHAVGYFRAALNNYPATASNTLRLRLYLARAYGGSGQVDRALEEYEAVINALRASTDDIMQIDVNGAKGYVPLCEAYAHYALCLFQRVGDPNTALLQYELAVNASMMEEDGRSNGRRRAPARTVEWIHEGIGALLLRIGRHADAVPHLEEKIEHAASRNDPAVDAHLHIASAYEGLGRTAEAREVYQHLYDLPAASLSRENRLDLTMRFAWLCHYAVGDYAAAVPLYLAALLLDSDNPHTMVQAAWCMLQLPEYDMGEIEALYVSAAFSVETNKHTPLSGQWDECYVLGECAVFHHDYSKKTDLAEQLYRQALQWKKSDNFAQVAANFAVFLHYEKHDSTQAMEWFETSIQANPRLTSVTTLFADFLIHTSQYDAAVRELEGLIPYNRVDAWHKLARIAERVQSGNSFDAVAAAYCSALAPEDISEAEAAQDSTIETLVGAAAASQIGVVLDFVTMLHYKAKRTALCGKLYASLVERFPKEALLHMHYGRFIFDSRGRRNAANQGFRRALSLEPNNVAVLDYYAEFLAVAYPERLDVAEAVHLHSVRVNPDSFQAHFSIASFLTHVHKAPQRAEEHYKQALALQPNDPSTLSCYATFLELQAELRGKQWANHSASVYYAEKMYEEAVRLSPSTASHIVLFANFLWRQRRYADGWERLRQALEVEPSNVFNLRLAAILLHDWYTATTASGATPTSPGADAVATGDTGGMTPGDMASIAESIFQRAIAIAPSDAGLLKAYAKFVDEVRRDTPLAASLDSAATQIEIAEHEAAIARAEADDIDDDDEEEDPHSDGADEDD